ncbi:MAG: hypothetical protein AAGA10_03915 [Bacteroidota bacterium]
MESLLAVIDNIFSQMKVYLDQIGEDRYQEKLDIFSGSSIGQHTRHIIEFFLCLVNQLEAKLINYDQRERKRDIEEDPAIAVLMLESLSKILREVQAPEALQLVTCYGAGGAEQTQVQTTFERELLYNIEHAVHHLAMIKIGLKAIAAEMELPDDFGIAQSTLSYRKNLQTH